MTMGPFTVAKQSYGKYQVSDRWNDHVALVDSYDHGQEWIKLFYQTLELEEQFLGINAVNRLALAQRERNTKARASVPAKTIDKRRKGVSKTTAKYAPLKLSCGTTIQVEAA